MRHRSLIFAFDHKMGWGEVRVWRGSKGAELTDVVLVETGDPVNIRPNTHGLRCSDPQILATHLVAKAVANG